MNTEEVCNSSTATELVNTSDGYNTVRTTTESAVATSEGLTTGNMDSRSNEHDLIALASVLLVVLATAVVVIFILWRRNLKKRSVQGWLNCSV